MQLALDPPTCSEEWGQCPDVIGAHSCRRFDRHQGRHTCECGAKRNRSPKQKKKALLQPKRSTLSNRADRLLSEKVRARGRCEMVLGSEIPCDGPWQACHVIGRRYRSVRWLEENLRCGCRNHHVYWTHRPEGFVLAIQAEAPGLYERLWALAQQRWDKDIESVLSALQGLQQEEE